MKDVHSRRILDSDCLAHRFREYLVNWGFACLLHQILNSLVTIIHIFRFLDSHLSILGFTSFDSVLKTAISGYRTRTRSCQLHGRPKASATESHGKAHAKHAASHRQTRQINGKHSSAQMHAQELEPGAKDQGQRQTITRQA